ncbi:MAG: site-specific DNA-methyltransferase [Candidatus Omnitrophica bacterium]|nr:site-specific DNA-methyltransferase [Candidatus Omnitrophota bacterium]
MQEEIYKSPSFISMTTLTQEKTIHKKDIFESIKSVPFKPYFEDKKHKLILYKENCFDALPKIPENSIDMIFVDPPYFLSNGGITCHAGKMVSVNKGKWDVSKGVEENYIFTQRWLRECQRVLTSNGTIWVSGTSHIIYTVGSAMQTLCYKILNDIAWFKVNPPPNLSCRYFTHSTETIIWAAKNKNSRHYFNYELMRKMNNNKQMLSLWSIKAPGPLEKIYGKHPTQKPLELLNRIVLASTKPGDVILDPFQGSGTTGIAAFREGRQYIGIEIEEEYLKTSIKRLKDAFRDKEKLSGNS